MLIAVRLLLLVAIMSLIGSSAMGACRGKIASITAPSSIFYNPFAPVDLRTPLTLTIQNTGSERCAYQLSIPDAYYPLHLNGKLRFTVQASSQNANSSLGAPRSSVATAVLQSGQSAKLAAILVIYRGQPSSSGVNAGTLGFTLMQAATTGSSPAILDQIQLPLLCTVPAIFEINLAGSGRWASLDFGELRSNDKKTVILQARSTEGHRLEFLSENKGYLIRGGSSPSDISKIPYVLSIDGQRVDLSGSSFFPSQAGGGETSRRIVVTIGDTHNKLAGTYKDVVTIHILSLL